MNNYWHTNYKADQEGVTNFRYVLRPHGKFSYAETEKAGASFSQPLLAWPVNENIILSDGLFDLSNNQIVVTSVTPQADGSIVIRLYNPETSAGQTNFLWKKIQPSKLTDLASGKAISIKEPISLVGMGVMELRIWQ
jgi:alpha-mannosidase